MKFEIGDRVRYAGLDGVVVSVEANEAYSVSVKFADDYYVSFTAEGKYALKHKEPSLFLVEKAKKEVQWFSVAAWRKTERRPFIPVHLFASEEGFLDLFSASKEEYHWIKLMPVCKTHGSSLVEGE